MPPEKIGSYTLIRELGKGAHGEVFLAENGSGQVALKVPQSVAAIETLRREISLAQTLDHLHITSIVDFDLESEKPFIATEYLTDTTLRDLLDEGKGGEDDLEIILQVAQGVSHAHDQGLLHGDIKPENILVAEGRAQLTDFGLAVMIDNELAKGSLTLSSFGSSGTNIAGTVAYLAPERLRGGPATRESDIYSLGVVMFEMLTGELPQFGDEHLLEAIKNESLRDIVRTSLNKNPKDRPSIDRLIDVMKPESQKADVVVARPQNGKDSKVEFYVQLGGVVVGGILLAILYGLTTMVSRFEESKKYSMEQKKRKVRAARVQAEEDKLDRMRRYLVPHKAELVTYKKLRGMGELKETSSDTRVYLQVQPYELLRASRGAVSLVVGDNEGKVNVQGELYGSNRFFHISSEIRDGDSQPVEIYGIYNGTIIIPEKLVVEGQEFRNHNAHNKRLKIVE